MSSIGKNEDRISSLPEEVLSHILSLMPTIYAVRTCILSKRWRYTWTFVTKLDFDDYLPARNLKSFSTYVDRVLESCKTSQLNSFRLGLSWLLEPNMSKWINEAIRLDVCELEIGVTRTELPLSLFTCKTLKKLRLVLSCDDSNVFDISSPIMLPGLKVLDLRVYTRPSANICKFLHGCPVLENLSLDIMRFDVDEEYYNFNIPTLKRLELQKTSGCIFVLNVPNLEYLFLGGCYRSRFVMEDLPYSVEATVSCDSIMNSSAHFELLDGLSGIKSLSWSFVQLNFSLSPLPKFPNLKHLELKGSFRSPWMVVIQILESSPELEHLSFQEPEESSWIEPQSVPTCMLSNLKTMKITKCKGRKCDIQFLEFVLGNAEVLRTLTIICGSLRMKEEMEMCARLLKFQRASRFCEIHFVGKWLNSMSN